MNVEKVKINEEQGNCPTDCLKEHTVNIGKIVEEQFEKSGFSVTEFGKRIHTTRENVYNIFRRKSMDSDLLQKISETLNHDFFQYYKKDILEKEVKEEDKNLIQQNNKLLCRLLKMLKNEHKVTKRNLSGKSRSKK
ncbi:MAG: hypothetical protein ABI199_05795 [Bacteroidia bacterium]